MESLLKIRKFENMHILFWLIKDVSWMMEWHVLGMAMIVPTIIIAVYLFIKTFKKADFYINLAVFFWISANSYWMCCEFLNHPELKKLAVIPFVLGLISTGYFYFKKYKDTSSVE